jgi:hypothetical protein
MLDVKVEKKNTESLQILGYLLKLIVQIGYLEFFSFEIWRIWAIFPTTNPLYCSKSYFSGQNLVKTCQLKKYKVPKFFYVEHVRGIGGMPQQELGAIGGSFFWQFLCS